MIRISIVLGVLSSLSVQAAEPPDWYAYIPPEQQAALLAARDFKAHSALNGVLGVQRQGLQGNALPARYTGLQGFDASALVHEPRYSLLYYAVQQNMTRRMLERERSPVRYHDYQTIRTLTAVPCLKYTPVVP